MLDRGAPDDLYLISTHENRHGEETTDTLPEPELRASLQRVLGAELPYTQFESARSNIGNSRLASRYRLGRVLLAGDAAHVFNAGGSALNVGLLDALALAPLLAGVASGAASLESLDAYEAERRPAAERTLAQTRTQSALSRDDELGVALRQLVGSLIASRAASRKVARWLEGA